jgi:hypothetical protein
MRSWQKSVWKDIIHVAGRPFVKGAYTPVVSPEMMESVPFVIQRERAKHLKKVLKN